MNLVGQETVRRLLEVVEDLRQDKQVQVVIFTSSTPGYFFNHVDLGQIAEFQALPSRDSTPAWVDLMVRVSRRRRLPTTRRASSTSARSMG